MISLKRFRYIISLLILGLSPSLFGQAVNATLLGTVTDSSGATVAGAKVTVTEVNELVNSRVRDAMTAATTPSQLAARQIHVTVSATGFKKETHQNIDLLMQLVNSRRRSM